MSPETSRSAWVASLALLARRDRSEGEVRARLLRLGYPEEEIGKTVSRLRERRYLDDRTLAREIAARRSRRRLQGPARVAAHLRSRLFAEELIEEAVRSAFPEDTELLRARDALRKMQQASRPPDSKAARRRLYSRGFSSDVIGEVVARYPGGNPS